MSQETLYVVGSHFRNSADRPHQRSHGYATVAQFRTLAEAVEAAVFDWRANVHPGAEVEHAVYVADDGSALIEIRQKGGNSFAALGYYKVLPCQPAG